MKDEKRQEKFQIDGDTPIFQRQSSTFQVPCGEHSIWDALAEETVTPFQASVYLVLTYFSNWESGKTHGISYSRIAEHMHVKRSRVVSAINALIEKGWVEKNVRNVLEKHHQGTANTYELIHHKCIPELAPRDKDGLPKKCAMPYREGSAMEKMFTGEISWQACLYWHVAKIESNWTSGVVEFTIQKARELTRLGRDTVYAVRKMLSEKGLLQRLSKRFCRFVGQLIPAPYEKRRTRRRENPKAMRCDGEFYYSFNELWRVSRKDGSIQAKEEGPKGGWRYSNEYELERVNFKILFDFRPIIELVTSAGWQRFQNA